MEVNKKEKRKFPFHRSGVLIFCVVLGLFFSVGASIWIFKLAAVGEGPGAGLSDALKKNADVYLVSPPNRGVIMESVDYKTALFRGGAMLKIPSEDARRIQSHIPVLFKTEDGEPIDFYGKISSISEGHGVFEGSSIIRIKIPPQSYGAFLTLAKDKKITGSSVLATFRVALTGIVPRLPLSALVSSHKKGDPDFVWEAVFEPPLLPPMPGAERDLNPQIEGRFLRKRPVEILYKAQDFFAFEGAYESDVYVLNPDPSFREAQRVKTQTALFHVKEDHQAEALFKKQEQEEQDKLFGVLYDIGVALRARDIGGQQSRAVLSPKQGDMTSGEAESCSEELGVLSSFLDRVGAVSGTGGSQEPSRCQ